MYLLVGIGIGIVLLYQEELLMCCCKNWTARYNSKAESLLTEPTQLIGQNIERPDHINSGNIYSTLTDREERRGEGYRRDTINPKYFLYEAVSRIYQHERFYIIVKEGALSARLSLFCMNNLQL